MYDQNDMVVLVNYNLGLLFRQEHFCLHISKFEAPDGKKLANPEELIHLMTLEDLIETERHDEVYSLTELGYRLAESGRWEPKTDPEPDLSSASNARRSLRYNLITPPPVEKSKFRKLIGLWPLFIIIAMIIVVILANIFLEPRNPGFDLPGRNDEQKILRDMQQTLDSMGIGK